MAKNLRKIVIGLLIAALNTVTFADSNQMKIVRQQALPNQLGAFRQINLNAKDNTAIIYSVTLNKSYRANLFLQKKSIQFFADYLDELSKKNDFTVGINGGYYLPDFTPAGLFIYQGKTIKPLAHDVLLKTCITINNQQKITFQTNLNQCTNVNFAMQTGLLLVSDGKVNSTLQIMQGKIKATREFFTAHKRTLLALSNNDDLIIITTSPIGLLDLAEALQNYPDAFGVEKIKSAINLDGGSSTGMYVRFKDEPFYYHELMHVKTFLFIR